MKISICAVLVSAAAILAQAQTTTSAAKPAPAKPASASKTASGSAAVSNKQLNPKPAHYTPTRKAAAVKATPVTPLTIPASAVQQPDGSYRYKDPQGTDWIYRNTPFGVSRATEASVRAMQGTDSEAPGSRVQHQASQDRDEKVTAVSKGETIEFARPTPFGVTRWQKPKNSLTADEQKIWDREQAKRNQ